MNQEICEKVVDYANLLVSEGTLDEEALHDEDFILEVADNYHALLRENYYDEEPDILQAAFAEPANEHGYSICRDDALEKKQRSSGDIEL